jgi:hypothetical protein
MVATRLRQTGRHVAIPICQLSTCTYTAYTDADYQKVTTAPAYTDTYTESCTDTRSGTCTTITPARWFASGEPFAEIYALLTEICALLTEICALLTEFCALLTEFYALLTEFYALLTEIYALLTEIYALLTVKFSRELRVPAHWQHAAVEGFSSVGASVGGCCCNQLTFSVSVGSAGAFFARVIWPVAAGGIEKNAISC